MEWVVFLICLVYAAMLGTLLGAISLIFCPRQTPDQKAIQQLQKTTMNAKEEIKKAARDYRSEVDKVLKQSKRRS